MEYGLDYEYDQCKERHEDIISKLSVIGNPGYIATHEWILNLLSKYEAEIGVCSEQQESEMFDIHV